MVTSFQFTLPSLAAVALAAVTLAVALYAWRQLAAFGSLPLVLLSLVATLWALCYALEVASLDPAAKIFWVKLQIACAALAPVLWLMCALHSAGHQPLMGWRHVVLWLIIPVIVVVLAFTNELHGLMWGRVAVSRSGAALPLQQARGIAFWLNSIYGLALALLVTVVTTAAVLRLPLFRRRYATAVLFGAVLPWVGDALYLAGLDLAAPAAYVLGGLIISWGLYQIRLLNLVPIARSAIVENMPDGVIVLDDKNNVIDCNPAAQQLLGVPAASLVGQPAAEVLRISSNLVDRQDLAGVGPSEVDLNGRACELRISLVTDRLGRITGRMMMLHDITERKRAEQELREQKELLENLVTVARATSEQPALEATLHNVLRVGVNLTAADRGSLFLLNNAGEVTQTLLVRDDAPLAERRAIIGQLMNKGLAGWVVRQRQTALIVDTQQDDRWLPLSSEALTRSTLAVPILNDQSLLGVLILTHSMPGHFTTEHAGVVEAAADQMALAIRNAGLFDVQQRMAKRQTTLYEVLRAVSGQLNADVIAKTAVESIAHFAGWPNVALLLPDAEQRNWVVRAVSGNPAMPLGLTLPIGADAHRNLFDAGHPSAAAELTDLAARASDAMQLIVPLSHAGSLFGILNIESTESASFDKDDLSLAQSLGDAVALALVNAQLFEAIAAEHSRLLATIRFNRDGIALLGMDYRILVINAPALQLLGLPGETDEWLNRLFSDVVRHLRSSNPVVVKAILREMRRIQNGDEQPAEGDYEIVPHAIRWISLPVLSNTLPIGRLIILRDVTEERLLAEMREDLTNTMVHDLRNPASILLGALDLLDAEELLDAHREIVKFAQQGAKRLLELVNAILDVNRLESGQMPLEREPSRFDGIATEVVEMERVLAGDKQQRLENDVPRNLPLVSVDEELIRRVVQNLMSNAIKFTPSGGVVYIDARVDPSDVKWLLVSVRDTGPGIPLDLQPRLFQKFVTGRARGRGSGLGLAFCRLAVEAHGGRIWVEAAPGQGANFHFTLPVVEN